MKKWWVVLILFSCNVSEKTKRDQFFMKANEQLDLMEFQEAIRLYDLALELDPQFAEGLNNRGVAKVEAGRPEEAILDYNEAIGLNQDYYEAIFNRAYAYEQMGRYDKSLADIATLEQVFPDSAYLHFYKGILLNSKREYNSAVTSFKRAISLNPANLEARVNLATVYFFMELLDSARQELRVVLKENPAESNAYNTFSQVYLAESDFQNALISINRALEIIPQEPYFLNNRGFVYLQMDSLNLALADINRSISIDPLNAWAYRNKGIYYLKTNDPAQAIRLFQDAINRKVFIDEVYAYLGEAQWRSNLKTEACGSWRKGAELQEVRSKSYLQINCQ